MTAPVDAIKSTVQSVTKDWAKQRKAEERDRNAAFNRRTRLIPSYRVTLREAAFEVMEEAYLAASDAGSLPVKPRQIMYAARPKILAMTGDDELSDSYFSQTLLIDYVEEHDCTDWDIIWDARGHFIEPHTGIETALGTLEVRQYLGERPEFRASTCGTNFVLPDQRPEEPFRQYPLHRERGLPPHPAGGPATRAFRRRAHEHERDERNGSAKAARRTVAACRKHLRFARLRPQWLFHMRHARH